MWTRCSFSGRTVPVVWPTRRSPAACPWWLEKVRPSTSSSRDHSPDVARTLDRLWHYASFDLFSCVSPKTSEIIKGNNYFLHYKKRSIALKCRILTLLSICQTILMAVVCENSFSVRSCLCPWVRFVRATFTTVFCFVFNPLWVTKSGFCKSTHRALKLYTFILYLCNVYCIPYIFLCLPGLVQEQSGFCVLLHWVNPEHLVYLSFSCALYELHILPACNWAFLTPLLRPSNHLDRVEQGTHPWLGRYFLSEKDMLRLLDWKCEWCQKFN